MFGKEEILDREELYKAFHSQKCEMTSEERLSAYLRGEEVDCLPFSILSSRDAYAAVRGISLSDLRASFEIRRGQVQWAKDTFGITGISIALGLRGMGEAIGSVLAYPENRCDYIKEFAIENYDQLGLAENFEARDSKLLLARLEEGKRMKDAFPSMDIFTNVAGPLSTASALRPIDLVLRDMYKAPDKLERLLNSSIDDSLQWIRMFHETFPDGSVGIADPVTTTDILGRKYFEVFSKPYFKRLFDGITEITGRKPSIHICGHTKKIWPDLMEIGMDNFSFDNCESVLEAKEILGGKVFLSGNVDPVDVMLKGTIDSVIQAVKETIRQGSDSPCGYLLATGCQVPIGTPMENLTAYVYAARKYGVGAVKGRMCGKAWEED